jgi:Rieske Fe-S protein
VNESPRDPVAETVTPVARRGFLGLLGLGLTALVAMAGAAVGAVVLAAPALRSRKQDDEGSWSPIGEPGDHPTRTSVATVTDAGWAKVFGTAAVFVDRRPDGELVAFSARCPHEGCQVEWEAERNRFVCPCHSSVWERSGARVEGPTRRGLDPLELRRDQQGGLKVRYVRYELDTAKRRAVG